MLTVSFYVVVLSGSDKVHCVVVVVAATLLLLLLLWRINAINRSITVNGVL